MTISPFTHQRVPLLPEGGVPMLLAVRVRTDTAQLAKVTVTSINDNTPSPVLHVDGVLLLTGPEVLASLVEHGLRSLTISNGQPNR